MLSIFIARLFQSKSPENQTGNRSYYTSRHAWPQRTVRHPLRSALLSTNSFSPPGSGRLHCGCRMHRTLGCSQIWLKVRVPPSPPPPPHVHIPSQKSRWMNASYESEKFTAIGQTVQFATQVEASRHSLLTFALYLIVHVWGTRNGRKASPILQLPQRILQLLYFVWWNSICIWIATTHRASQKCALIAWMVA